MLPCWDLLLLKYKMLLYSQSHYKHLKNLSMPVSMMFFCSKPIRKVTYNSEAEGIGLSASKHNIHQYPAWAAFHMEKPLGIC